GARAAGGAGGEGGGQGPRARGGGAHGAREGVEQRVRDAKPALRALDEIAIDRAPLHRHAAEDLAQGGTQGRRTLGHHDALEAPSENRVERMSLRRRRWRRGCLEGSTVAVETQRGEEGVAEPPERAGKPAALRR